MASYNYSGNNDFRGYLAGDATRSWALDYAGNDGGVNMDKLNKAGGVSRAYQANGSPVSALPSAASKIIQDLYRQYTGLYNNDLKASAGSASNAAASAIAALTA